MLAGVPVLALAAFGGGGGSDPTRSAASRGWVGGKVAPAPEAALPTLAAQRAAIRRLLPLGVPIYCSGGRGRYVALTLDDGPSELTPQFHRLLKRYGVRPTFFVVGGNMTSATLAGYARAHAKLGAVGDHTWTHANLSQVSDAQVEEEIVRAKVAIERVTGAPVLVFRPPQGAHTAMVARVTRENGMLEILWNTESRDWDGSKTARQIADNVLAGLKPGSIVVMHETKPETLAALRDFVLPELERRNLKAVTVPELLALDPPSLAQVRDDGARGACGRGQYDGT